MGDSIDTSTTTDRTTLEITPLISAPSSSIRYTVVQERKALRRVLVGTTVEYNSRVKVEPETETWAHTVQSKLRPILCTLHGYRQKSYQLRQKVKKTDTHDYNGGVSLSNQRG